MLLFRSKFNPIPDGVFWVTHTWGGQILLAPCNTAILKDMDLKFGMLKQLVSLFKTIKEFMQIS